MPVEKKEKKGKDEAEVNKGMYIFPNGDKYDGFFIQIDGCQQRCGSGTNYFVDGVIYEGQWEHDKMSGPGKLTHPSGAVYEGDFVNNQFNGRGKYSWPNGSFYEGEFVENRIEGDGQFTYTEGQVWTGVFRFKAAPGLRFKLNLD